MWLRPGDVSERVWSRAAYVYAIVLALGLAYFLIRMPYQVTDNLEHILIIQFQTPRDLVVDSTTGDGSLRPVQWLQQKAVFELVPGDRYWSTYKAVHVGQLLLLALLFVRMLRIRTKGDFVALPLALAALVGMHTFNGTMREAYPINHYTTILICCLAVINLALARHAWWHDAAAVLLFAYAVLTLETGLLVWVCLLAGFAAGWRGVSWKGVAAATAVLAAYFVVRFVVLDIGGRTLMSLSSGYGFSVRSTADLERMFGDSPWMFYLYNIASSVLTVLLSEPRAGVFQFTSFIARGEVPAWSIVNVLASAIGTALILAYTWRRLRRWMELRTLERGDGLLMVFLAVLGANAVMSYAYTKDVIMSPAGMFYAAALFVATRDIVAQVNLRPRMVVFATLLVVSAGWTLRGATLMTTLQTAAFVNRSDWAVADEHLDENRPNWRGRHADAERLFVALRERVIRTPVPQPYTGSRWTRTWLDPY